ncbi:MAG: tRNA (guanine(46)-N(7))-methyltransferase TrmB [Bdellovibrionales bacterium]|jgi:tRNA (guanine-N7-)-methyltransferase
MAEQIKTSPKRLFGRRKGRPLRAGRVSLMETLLPRVAITIGEGGRVDPFALFDAVPEAVRLEIGFGGGEHLAAQAAANPSVGFMGCEPFVNGVAKLLTQIEAQDLKNVRVYPDDARVLLDALPDACLDMCFVLYADPWPKTRHAERRFIGKENLDRLARVLTAGGQLRLATDVAALAQWMREQTNAHPSFACVYDGPQAPADWVPTRYEQKGIAAGRTPTYLVYKRV